MGAQIGGEPGGATEAAAAGRHRLRRRVARAAGKRQHHRASRRGASPPASWRASAVPPRMRIWCIMALLDAAPTPWLSIVGIGEDGAEGLSPAARGLVEAAETVFGGRRHLALAGALVRGEARPWPSPFDAGITDVVARRGRRVCVLASGDPFLHGVGATLTRHVSGGGDARRTGAERHQPGRRPPRLAARRGRHARPARPADQPAEAAPAWRRAHPGAHRRQRRAGRDRRPADPPRLRPVPPHRARSPRRAAPAHPLHPGPGFCGKFRARSRRAWRICRYRPAQPGRPPGGGDA